MNLKRMLFTIVMTALVLSACNAQLTPTSATPTVQTTASQVPRFEPAQCWFTEPAGHTVECGYLIVPEDHAKPAGSTLKLAVARFKSDAASPEKDPIVYLEGGPGASPLRSYPPQFELIFGPLLQKRDLILFDQRGTGYSEPALDCPEQAKLALDTLDQDLNAQKSEELNNQALLTCHDRLAKAGVNFEVYNSAQNAADIESLRQAMGYDKLNLYGISYGTRLALTAMRDMAPGIRSVVIGSVYPPQVDLYSQTPANGARAFEALFKACSVEATCAQHFPNLRQVFFDLKNKLDKQPVKFNVQLPTGETKEALLNGDGLVGLVFQSMYATSVIPLIPQMIFDIRDGSYDVAAGLQGEFLSEFDKISAGMQYAVQCKEEVPFTKQADITAVAGQYPDYAALASRNAPALCTAWGETPAGPIENQPVTSDLPTLVFSGEFDPITPPAWAEETAKTLSHSFYFDIPHSGHGASLTEDCPRNMVLAFFDNPGQKPDAACLNEMTKTTFAVPLQAADIKLVPFSETSMKIGGVVPEGWKRVSVGAYTPGGKLTDQTALLQQAAPVAPDMLLNLLESQLAQSDVKVKFEQTGSRSANGLDWKLYSAKAAISGIDLALGQKDATTYLVLLQSPLSDRAVLYQAVFLAAIDNLKAQ